MAKKMLGGTSLTDEDAARLEFLVERYGNPSDAVRKAIELLFDREEADRKSLNEAVQHFRKKVREIEAGWEPLWTGEDLMHIRRVLAEFDRTG